MPAKQFSHHLVPAILWAAEYAIKEQMERETNSPDRAHGSDDGSSCRVAFTSKSAERRRSCEARRPAHIDNARVLRPQLDDPKYEHHEPGTCSNPYDLFLPCEH